MIQQAGIVLLLTWHLDWITILNLLSKQWRPKQIHLIIYWENPKCSRLTWLSIYWALTILEHRSISRAEEHLHCWIVTENIQKENSPRSSRQLTKGQGQIINQSYKFSSEKIKDWCRKAKLEQCESQFFQLKF